ncbi:MAG TPA: HAD-IA family hydrolase [Gaiellaceae bacterium]|nr:HAD-IA family hydrolase [Gaiellaceae bacterium]
MPQPVVPVVQPPEQIVGVDSLRARWKTAFGAADAALAAAGGDLPEPERRAYARELQRERESTSELLQALARDQRESALFLRRFMSPGEARRQLGLPPEVIAFVFRLDGVLIASAAVHAAAWKETFDEFISNRIERTRGRFAHFDRQTDYYAHIHGKPRLEGVRAFLASRGIRLPEGSPDDPPGTETVHGLANRKQEALVRRLEESGVRVFEGSRQFLELAHDAGIRSAVVSASAHTYMILARAGLADYVDEVVDANTIAAQGLREKPQPDWLLAACRELEVSPARAVVFETDPAGCAAGRAAGFDVVVATDRTGDPAACREAGADVVIEGIADLLDRDLAALL